VPVNPLLLLLLLWRYSSFGWNQLSSPVTFSRTSSLSKRIIQATVMPFHTHLSAVGNPTTTANILVSQSLLHLLHGSVSNAKLHYNFPNCCSSVCCDECINFLHIAFDASSPWLTSVRQIGDVPAASHL
jgi:hypothetical protein